ncbi:MAG: tetratricopeptide repeat protein [Candidatus Aminicenantes bacterium]|nr:tetratricopeptide repeat protein [Candidatus Aminicenantes bacterium]NIR07931.1 tetratricopeptide repeat protein [Candidatus Aminicenantes bacterium]NIT25267.1 tetratricopeptide repeat protein [Candidatus Aminicenantes bacterium]
MIEISLDSEIKAVDYYVTPIVRDLLKSFEKTEERWSFSHQQAGIYYYYYFHNIERSLTFLEEAFYHFDKSGDKEKVQEIGDWLSRVYYNYSMYGNAFVYARRVYEVLGDETKGHILNRLGLIYDLYGDYKQALIFYQKALAVCQKLGDKKNEGTTLNNMATISLAHGDYESALTYLEQSLKISRETGDKSGTSHTLHNMAIIAHEKGDIKKFMEYETTAYQMALDINDAMGIYNIDRQLGYALCQSGGEESKKQGIEMLQRSLHIGKAAGFPDTEVVEQILQSLGVEGE